MDNSNRPAFPIVGEAAGLSKREYFAGLAMQSMICVLDIDKLKPNESVLIAGCAVSAADALIAELAKEQPK